MSQMNPQPLPEMSYRAVFGMKNEDERIEYMKQLGAKNLDPPLMRSSHLRNKINGRVLPWDEMLAEQTDIMECCDASGNTDPAAWMPTVDTSEHGPDEQRELMVQARIAVMAQAKKTQSEYQQAGTSLEYKPDGGFPSGIVPYDEVETITQQDMDNLINMVNS